MQIHLDLDSLESYRLFLRIKGLPRFRLRGRVAEVPDEYAALLGRAAGQQGRVEYTPSPFLFDYQRDIARLAIRKQKFAVFAQCGLGKSLILLDYARHVSSVLPQGRRVLIVSPLMVVKQTMAEAQRFYGDSLRLEQVRAAGLKEWLTAPEGGIGITNYEAITDGLKPGHLGALILDESGALKSAYGKWGQRLVEMGSGLQWKLCLTGTPAPNDRIEYATHAVFLDQFPTVNAFLARYFINRGQTDNRWELKPHALRPFYVSLSHWCIFLENPATYGWKDNIDNIPPIHVHIHDVPLTDEQQRLVLLAGGGMFGTPGGITSRAKLSQLAKGRFRGEEVPTNKPAFLRQLVDSWPEESTIIWTRFNHEQETLEKVLPEAGSLKGESSEEERERVIRDFQERRLRTVITKPAIMGWGLNLQVATRQVFSSCEDSFESFHQAVKRSNRIGSTRPLNVHLPVTLLERQMMENVLRKAHRVQQDTDEQERLFKEVGLPGLKAGESWIGKEGCNAQ